MIASVYAPPPIDAQKLLYLDDDIVVVVKPSGLLSVPGRGPEKAICAQSYVERKFGPVLTVHRLDMDTSGILLFARNKSAQTSLSLQFEKRRVEKKYEAVVSGQVQRHDGEINLPIAKYSIRRPMRHIDPEGQEAITAWSRISTTSMSSRLALFPKTGRSHQLRLHLKSFGHPILGDALYGDSQSANRLLLHASTIVFTCPNEGKPVYLEAETPF